MTDDGYLTGKVLMSMPSLDESLFERSVIYVCTHNKHGAMGLIINKPSIGLTFPSLLKQLKIKVKDPDDSILIHAGGPVETGRGFVLHSADYVQESTLNVSETIALTATTDILRAMAEKRGPTNSIMALGHAGWGPGQLDDELHQNAWLTTEADDEIIFNTPIENKWPRAMAMLGVDISMLSMQSGHA